MILERKTKIRIGLGVVAVLLLAKLFTIQIIDQQYKIDASNNSMVYDIIYPTRGVIYDRNGEILVGNKENAKVALEKIISRKIKNKIKSTLEKNENEDSK